METAQQVGGKVGPVEMVALRREEQRSEPREEDAARAKHTEQFPEGSIEIHHVLEHVGREDRIEQRSGNGSPSDWVWMNRQLATLSVAAARFACRMAPRSMSTPTTERTRARATASPPPAASEIQHVDIVRADLAKYLPALPFARSLAR